MESSSSSGGAKQRSLAQENSNLNVNDFLDDLTSKNTKKLINCTISMYNQTMESLNSKDGSNSYNLLDDTPWMNCLRTFASSLWFVSKLMDLYSMPVA